MPILRNLIHQTRESRAATPARTFEYELNGGQQTAAGVPVTQESGARLAAAYACIRFLAETVGQLSWQNYRKNSEGEARPMPRPRWLDAPNLDMDPITFREQLVHSLNIDGNAYALVTYGRDDQAVEFQPLHPSEVTVSRDTAGRPAYTVRGKDRLRRDVLHVQGYGEPGSLVGLSPIEHCRATFGLAQAAEAFGGRFFANGAHLSGVIEHPGEPKDGELRKMARGWRKAHTGRNAHTPGVLSGGATWKPMAIPNDQAQFLETRKFSRTEIAGIYRVPPHVIGDLDRATFSNIEHQGLEVVRYTLNPWMQRLEQRLSRYLPAGQYLKFNPEALLRGDTLNRYRSYAVARQWGWMNVDEIRDLEDLPALPGGAGEEYLVPVNMAEAGDPDAGRAEQEST